MLWKKVYFKVGNVWLPFHQRKLRQMENINPMKKFSMMIVGQHLGIPFHQRKLRQMGSVNCPMMKFSMMIQIRLTIFIAGQYWIPFHQRKLRKMGNVNPVKKFSMMIAGQHLGIPFHQRKLRQMGSVNCPMMKFSMMIQIRLTIFIAGQYWIPFHQRKLRKMGNVNPVKKFSMMIAGQHWIPFHQRKLRQMGNVNPMKTFSMMIAGQHWIPFQQRKRDLLRGSIYLKKDLRHPELLSEFL